MLFKKYRAVVCSFIGGRENQEDNFFLYPSYYLTPQMRHIQETERNPYYFSRSFGKTMMAMVCDGMGGHEFGEEASCRTAQYFSRNCSILSDAETLTESEIVRFVDALNTDFREFANSDPAYADMGTTLCGIIIRNGAAFCVHVGDSVLFRYENKKLTRLTKPQNLGQMLMDKGISEDGDVLGGKGLCNYIGIHEKEIAEVFPITPPDHKSVYMLATDGITDALSEDRICSILNSYENLETLGRRLTTEAYAAAGECGDNQTIILITAV